MTKVTYDDLVGLLDAELDVSQPLGRSVDHILDSARINADDAVHVEKNGDDWNSVAMATVEEQLCYCDDAEVKAWFAGHGVKW